MTQDRWLSRLDNTGARTLLSTEDLQLSRRLGKRLRACFGELRDGLARTHRLELPGVFEEAAKWTDVDHRLESGLLLSLLGLLLTGGENWAAVYFDRRNALLDNFDPALASSERRALLERMLPREYELLASYLPSEFRVATGGMLERLHVPLLREPAHTVRIALLGDCLLSEIRAFVRYGLSTQGIDLQSYHRYISVWAMRRAYPVAPAEIEIGRFIDAIEQNHADFAAMSLFTYDGLMQYRLLVQAVIQGDSAATKAALGELRLAIENAIASVRAETAVPLILHGVSGIFPRTRRFLSPFVTHPEAYEAALDELNASIQEVACRYPKVWFLDEREVSRAIGRERCILPAVPFAALGLGPIEVDVHNSVLSARLAREYTRILSAYVKLGKRKVIVTDLDGTLWDGVVAEGPVNHHLDRQRLLKSLKEQGLLLAVASKNTPENVDWTGAELSASDFVLAKVSWDHKVQSMKGIAGALDMPEEAIVFIDDRAEERAMVQEFLGGVATLDANAPATWRTLQLLTLFPNTATTPEARSRTELYKARAERAAAGPSTGAMLASLGLVAREHRPTPEDLPRVAELLARTNQFNCTGARFKLNELGRMLADGVDLLAYELLDKFGSMGKVGFVATSRRGELVCVDAFVMSCRAMGFGLEQLMLARVFERRPGLLVRGVFIPTSRNQPASTLYSDAGFVATDGTHWIGDPRTVRISRPPWLSLDVPATEPGRLATSDQMLDTALC